MEKRFGLGILHVPERRRRRLRSRGLIILEPERRSFDMFKLDRVFVESKPTLTLSYEKTQEYHITSYQLHPFSENHDRLCDFASAEVSFLDLFGDKKRKPNRRGH